MPGARRIVNCWTLMAALLAAYAVLRIFHTPFQNDELQHLHVVWSWTRGLTQYKDVFDNHAPLYHIVTAHLAGCLALGPSQYFPVWARFLSLPFFAGTLALVYAALRRAFRLAPGEAFAAACLTGLVTPFIAMAARPEPMWLFFFFLSVAVFTGDKSGAAEGFLAGLANGAGAAVSLKTLALLLPAQALAAAAMRFSGGRRRGWEFWAAFAAGLAVVPALVCLYFARLDALRELAYYTVAYNTGGAGARLPAARAAAAALAAGVIFLANRAFSGRDEGTRMFLSITAFSGLLLLLYPVMELQTMLPFRLLLYAAAAAMLARCGRGLNETARWPAFIAAFAAVLCFQLWNTRAIPDGTAEQREGLRRVLALTGPDDYIMDAKGESIFRRRPFYYGLEYLATRRMAAGEIADDIPERLETTGTKAVLLWLPARFTARDMAFFRDNYLPVRGHGDYLLAAGKTVNTSRGAATADILIPAYYSAGCSGGSEVITVDGRPYTGPLFLGRGDHKVAATGCGSVNLVWAGAAGGTI